MRGPSSADCSLEVLKQVDKVLEGEEACELPDLMSASQAASLKFCPIASCDVEHSFSLYKAVLSDRRSVPFHGGKLG